MAGFACLRKSLLLVEEGEFVVDDTGDKMARVEPRRCQPYRQKQFESPRSGRVLLVFEMKQWLKARSVSAKLHKRVEAQTE